MKNLSDWCASKLVGGVLLDSYCQVVDLFWDHNWLKPRTRVSIMVKYWSCKSGRGGAFGLILTTGRFIILEIYLCQISRSVCKSGRGGAFGLILQSGTFILGP